MVKRHEVKDALHFHEDIFKKNVQKNYKSATFLNILY